jgi:hypothetical protein
MRAEADLHHCVVRRGCGVVAWVARARRPTAIQLDGFAVDDVLQLSRGLNATAADDGLAEKR